MLLGRYRDRAQMTEAEQQLVSDTLEDLEQRFSFKIPPGTNPDLQFMAHLWQPLRVSHKPLLVHAISEVSVIFTHAILLFMGFERRNGASFTYWTKHMAPPTPEIQMPKVRFGTACRNLQCTHPQASRLKTAPSTPVPRSVTTE